MGRLRMAASPLPGLRPNAGHRHCPGDEFTEMQHHGWCRLCPGESLLNTNKESSTTHDDY